MASNTALGKRSSSHALMAPPPARPKRIKRPSTVLDEDTYVSAVSHIIRRDFFPGLAEEDAQREYLDAVESNDRGWIREAGKTLTHVMTPVPGVRSRVAAARTRLGHENCPLDKTPRVWGEDTPISVAGTVLSPAEEGLAKLDRADLDLSLGAFQAKYISEDQESFSQIIDKHNQARFEKNRWVRDGNMYASKQRIAQQKVLEARAAASASREVTVVSRPSQNLDDRPAAPTFHKHTAFNSLMFGPDSVEQWAPTRAQRAEDASLAPPKKVLYQNTRLSAQETEPARPPSPTISAVRDAVAGHPRLNPSEGGYDGSETPRVNGYAFVDARSSDPRGDADDAPTDLLEKFGIDSGSKSTPFTISDASTREKLHHKMVDKIALNRSHSSSSSSALSKNPVLGSGLGIFSSETPRFLSAPTPAHLQRTTAHTPARKVGKHELTPAAQRLFENMGGRTPKAGGVGSTVRKEQTPLSRIQKKT